MIAGLSMGQVSIWNPAANGIVPPAEGNWNTAANWDGSAVATGKAVFNVANAATCILDSTQTLSDTLVIGDGGETGAAGTLVLTNGANLSVAGYFTSGWENGGKTVVYDGASLSCASFWLGVVSDVDAVSTNELIVKGGTVTIAGDLKAQVVDEYACIQLDGGTVTAGDLLLNAGYCDITGGTLILQGDEQADMAALIDNGRLTAFGGAGMVVMSYDAGLDQTTITGVTALDLVPSTSTTDGAYTTESYLGRTVWVPINTYGRLYFDVPDVSFPVGERVYVRIEYLDTGRGRFFVEYDATHNNYADSEIHTRSSRVGNGEFVYSYQVFESPRFFGSQSGGNDFRFQLQNSDGTPLRVASVQISTEPYDDEQLQYAASRPWLTPYAGPVKDFVTTNTLVGKVMTGYQGWFATPNDLGDQGWVHWGRNSASDIDATQITIDQWPYINDYNPEQIYSTGALNLPDGRPAYLFSSRDPGTVRRHFRWMRKHNIDGAYLQRFVSRYSSGAYGASEFVLNNVREAANKEGRVWAIEYDISSLDQDDPFGVITNDWNFLVDEVGILEDPRYIHEGSQPVLFIWGFSVEGRPFNVTQANQIIDWFSAQGLYLIGGVNSWWEDKTDWYAHYQRYDQLLGWMEDSRTDLVNQKNQLASWGMKILPHAWPGFSWHNLQQLTPFQEYTGRAGGDFYWDRLYNAVYCGADQIFLGMFDEYDEGVAIMPMIDNHPAPHTAWGHYIDNEGNDPFWYLQLSGAAHEMLDGFRSVSGSMPSVGSISPTAYANDDDATAYLGAANIEEGLVQIEPVDGVTSPAVIGGQDCRSNASDSAFYFYFNIDDGLCFGNADGQNVTVEVEYYDSTSATQIRLQYDGLAGAYTQHPDIVVPPNSGGWKTVRWNISDGFFGNRQNDGSDFRIALALPGEYAAIRRVSIFLPEEQDGKVWGTVPQIELSDNEIAWPESYDAVGWRLNETPSLTDPVWQEVSGPFVFANGVVEYEPQVITNLFYRLERPARQ